jgi:uncharacterized membrane protein
VQGLSPVLDRNIAALRERRRREQRAATWHSRVAHAITHFAGSMIFVAVQLLVVGVWIAANRHWLPGIRAWDESLGMLGTATSIEAIFLSTFVLITQIRMAAADDKRAELDVQISLLMEHELTKIATLLGEMGKKMGVETDIEDELADIQQDVAPDAVLDHIEKQGGLREGTA